MHSSKEEERKLLLGISIAVNIGLLAAFKYYGFFVENFIEAFRLAGITIHSQTINLILPVGISFYTFQTLSYTIDIYRNQLRPTKDFIAFAAYVSFFPQLVAGPIERAKSLLPQFFEKKEFDRHQIVSGFRQVLWGFFKKLAIADNCAPYVDYIFENSDQLGSSTLIVGAFLFSFQIYCDFSGYSDIAIGIGKTLGFKLSVNFAYPYFSRDLGEFWKRWHISLNTWFRDYLYIPLGGSKVSKTKVVRNVFIIFLVSGFWHGANWTFVVWGFINACFFLPLILLGKNRTHLNQVGKGELMASSIEICQMIATYIFISFTWIFFRSETLTEALIYIQRIFSFSIFSIPELRINWLITLSLIIGFIVVEWIGRKDEFPLQALRTQPKPLRWGCYSLLILLIGIFGKTDSSQFIYFQF